MTELAVESLSADLGFPPQAGKFVGEKAASLAKRLLLGPPRPKIHQVPVCHSTYESLDKIPWLNDDNGSYAALVGTKFLVAARSKNGKVNYYGSSNGEPWWPMGTFPLGLVFPGSTKKDLSILVAVDNGNPYGAAKPKIVIPAKFVKVVHVDGRPYRIDSRVGWSPVVATAGSKRKRE